MTPAPTARSGELMLAGAGVLVGGLGVGYAGDGPRIIGGATLVLATVWILLVSLRLWRSPELVIAPSAIEP